MIITELGALTPAYGRDYKSAKAAKADFLADKDFIITAVTNPWCGKPVNLSQLREAYSPASRQVTLRFNRLTQTCIVDF